MNWEIFWKTALCLVVIAFCAGIYREMVSRDTSRRIDKQDPKA